MSDFIIATASTCDLDKDWLDAHHIPMISYTFEVNDQVYIDDCRAETKHAIFREMRAGHQPNTSQITVYSYYEFFKGLLETGKPVVFLDMDKELSASYYNSIQAADQIKEEMPEASLTIMDTRCVTMGLSLLIKNMVAMQEDGHSMKEVVDWGEKYKLRITHRFMVDDLEWLRRGGRLSNSSAVIGSLLSIKPLIYINDDGKLLAWAKIRGRKKAIKELLASIDHDIGDAAGKDIIVGHSDDPEEGEKWRQMVMEKYPSARSVTLQELGPVIGCHIGPGFLSIVYISEKEHREP
jgi:DegV family protein with EDD domain